MTTGVAGKARTAIMDCRDEPGNDKIEKVVHR
jgi:hypothetical protein